MSGVPTINVVEDEQMSSEGSVNAPVAPPRSPSVHSARATSPVEPVDLLSGRVSPIAKTLQAGSAGRERSTSVFSPIPPTEVVGAPFVPSNVPSRAETTQAFAEVSSVLRDVSSQHEEVRAGMQSLASGVETLRRARVADVETTAQVQATLQRTLSASSSLEARMEQAEVSQAQAKSAAAEAHIASQRALQQAARLEEEQMRTASTITGEFDGTGAASADIHCRCNSGCYVNSKRSKDSFRNSQEGRIYGTVDCSQSKRTNGAVRTKDERAAIPIHQRCSIAQEAQRKLTQQLQEAQGLAQTTKGMTTKYELQLAEVTGK